VYHQYTVQVLGGETVRDALKAYLQEQGIPTMIYYPLPLHHQPAFEGRCRLVGEMEQATRLAGSVLSLPMHPALTKVQQDYIISAIGSFFTNRLK
jgi:dTDP-4-amino-4,6-dideoxygalactose transaminase